MLATKTLTIVGALALAAAALTFGCDWCCCTSDSQNAVAAAEIGFEDEAPTEAVVTMLPRRENGPAIQGTIKWKGSAPKNKKFSAKSDPFCDKHCGEAPRKEVTVIGPKGGLKNVIVYVSKGLPKKDWPKNTETVLLDQKNCTYVPHVFGIQIGQPLKIKSSDNTSHNVHFKSRKNGDWNVSQNQPSTIDPAEAFRKPEVGTAMFKCDQHTWMEARVGIFDHPFFAVTGANGSFELKGDLPPGKYTVTAWHEKWKTKEKEIVVAADGMVNLELTFEKTKRRRR